MFRERRKAARSDIIPVTSPTFRFTSTTGCEKTAPGRFHPGKTPVRASGGTGRPEAHRQKTAPEQHRSGRTAQSHRPSAARFTLLAQTRGHKTAIPSKVPPIPRSSTCIFQTDAECPRIRGPRNLDGRPGRSRRAGTPPPDSDFAPLFVPRISPQRSSSACADRVIRAPEEGKSW